jgi:hypothetical protein
MSPSLQTFMTCMLAALAGWAVGIWGNPEQAKKSAKLVQTAKVEARAEPMPARTQRFSSVTASMEWVRIQMEKGDVTAAERLFQSDAGLSAEQRLAMAQELVKNARRMDPRLLARIILGLPRSDASDRLLWRLVSDWSTNDAEDALRFIETLPADRLNTAGVLTNSAFGLSKLPAERVLAFAAQLDDKGRAYLAEGLVGFADQGGSWRNTTAILAKLNVTRQKESQSMEWQLGVSLAEIEPEVVESQIRAETDAVKREEMLGGYAWITGLNDPPRGIELDGQMQNTERRAKNLSHHVMEWLQCDRAAALAWLQSADARQLMKRDERALLLRHYGMEAAP